MWGRAASHSAITTVSRRADLTPPLFCLILPSLITDFEPLSGDGDFDVAISFMGQPNKLFRNDGALRFVEVTDSPIAGGLKDSSGVAWADIDQDGDLDLLVLNALDSNQLFAFVLCPMLNGRSTPGGGGCAVCPGYSRRLDPFDSCLECPAHRQRDAAGVCSTCNLGM